MLIWPNAIIASNNTEGSTSMLPELGPSDVHWSGRKFQGVFLCKISHFVLIFIVFSYHFLLQKNGQNKPVSTVLSFRIPKHVQFQGIRITDCVL